MQITFKTLPQQSLSNIYLNYYIGIHKVLENSIEIFSQLMGHTCPRKAKKLMSHSKICTDVYSYTL